MLLLQEKYEETIMQINYDIAWQIFDEVNESNNTFEIIDLNCLDLLDAQAITKQKLYELSLAMREKENESFIKVPDKILCIVCSNEHFYQKTGKGGEHETLQNAMVEIIDKELQLDFHYLSDAKTILVRINSQTIENPVLKG